MVSGLITLSLRRNPELKEVGGDMQQRVLALGRAHDFVRPQSAEAASPHARNSLTGMLDSLLAAYQAAPGERVTVLGQDVRIDDRSATPLALFFHELATNAAKYGALSVGAGHVSIEIDTADPAVIVLTWHETGGPPAHLDPQPGFGTTLIEMSVTRQLGGTLERDWHDEGLRVRATIPAQMMSR